MHLISGFSRSAFIEIGVVTFFLSYLLMISACGDVSVRVGISNSEGTISDSVTIDNAQYNGALILLPYSGFADYPFSGLLAGSGRSTERSSNKFISSTSTGSDLATGSVGASVETTNGDFNFAKAATISSDAPSLAMSTNAAIESGTLAATFDNTGSTIGALISIDGGNYFTSAMIAPESITAVGSGVSQTSGESRLSSSIWSFGQDKYSTMNALLGESRLASPMVDFSWSNKAILNAMTSQMEQGLHIASKNGYGLQVSGSESSESVHAILTFDAKDSMSGKSLIGGTQYVPSSIFGQSGQPVYLVPQAYALGGHDTIDMVTLMKL